MRRGRPTPELTAERRVNLVVETIFFFPETTSQNSTQNLEAAVLRNMITQLLGVGHIILISGTLIRPERLLAFRTLTLSQLQLSVRTRTLAPG